MGGPGSGAHQGYTEREVKQVLTCVVSWSGNVARAVRHLEQDSELANVPHVDTIRYWIREEHLDLYNQLRDDYSEQIDRDMADRYRGVAAQATDATELAIKTAVEMLERGEDRDPARSAANLAMVADKTLRDHLLLEGKPTQISDNRGLPEVMRTLIDMGVLVPHAAPQIEEASTEVEAEE